MRCEEVREALVVRPHQADQHAAVRDHLAGCPQCSDYQAAQDRLDAALRSALVVEVPQPLQAILMARVLAEARQVCRAAPSSPSRLSPIEAVACGAAVALAVVAGTVLDGGGPLLSQTVEGLYVVALTLQNLFSSPAVWVLDWLVGYLLDLWYWVPGLVGLWVLARAVDRFPALR